jgi:flavin reductase (DIM6/NTAB) family NADH-FMN oxidoreductase RutF
VTAPQTTAADDGATQNGAHTQIDAAALRKALGAFPTGVTVVCARDAAGAPVGFTANSFTSVSLDPPLVLVCVGHGSSSHAAFRQAGAFAVSVLAREQADAARVFATPGAERFGAVRWSAQATGAPVVHAAAAWFDCETHQRVAAGDHDILIGRVVAFGRRVAAPLAYAAGGFSALEGGLRVAALVRAGETALFIQDEAGLRLPCAARFGPAEDADSLMGQVSPHARDFASPTPLVGFEDAAGHVTLYDAQAVDLSPGPGWVAAPLQDAADRMACPAQAAALRAARPKG